MRRPRYGSDNEKTGDEMAGPPRRSIFVDVLCTENA